MTQNTVLFVSHRDKNCGVYQFGRNVAEVLARSSVYRFVYVECSSFGELTSAIEAHTPAAVIYNYHPATQPWLTIAATKHIDVPQLGIMHEVTQRAADLADTTLFDFHIGPDPTLLLRNPRVFKTGRYIPKYQNTFAPPTKTTIGSFGFATTGKGFERVVREAHAAFDSAHIRLHIPYARYGDASGERARRISETCRSLVTKPGVTLEITHDFLETEQLLDFLASNSLNVFLYEELHGRGISSVIDYALAVQRPFAVSTSTMFRHVRDAYPSITVDDSGLAQILANGTAPLHRFTAEWTHENLLWEYERIVREALQIASRSPKKTGLRGHRVTRTLSAKSLAKAKRGLDLALRVTAPALARVMPEEEGRARHVMDRVGAVVALGVSRLGNEGIASADWIPRSTAEAHRTAPRAPLAPLVPLSTTTSFNRILDDAARELYADAISYLGRAAPEVIKRKIARANVQQAFVLDTVMQFAGVPGEKKLLCVGSYEDTAAMALARSGYPIEEVDPVLNYDLAVFVTKPSVHLATYDIVFSTSVIEHVADDEDFVEKIAALLKPGGVAVLTCDFRDGYRPGDPMPVQDRRLYTVDDLERRLLRHMPDCELVDRPRWSGIAPDFEFGGTMYSFATFVVRKRAP